MLEIIGIIIISLFIILQISTGVIYILNSPKKIIDYKLKKMKAKYKIVNENKCIFITGKYNIISGTFILILFIIQLFLRIDTDAIILLIFILIGISFRKKYEAEIKKSCS